MCDILGYVNSRKALDDHLDEDEKGVTKCDTPAARRSVSASPRSRLRLDYSVRNSQDKRR